MNNVVNEIGAWLLYSSLALSLVTVFIFILRKVLIRMNYARSVILRLWIAIPLSILFCFLALIMKDVNSIFDQITMSVPLQIKSLSQSSVHYFDWLLVLVLAWIVIAVWKLMRLIYHYKKTKKTIINHCFLSHDNIYYTDLSISPMAFGLFKPIILLPKTLLQSLKPDELDLVILHESIHCHRRDPFWRFVFEFIRRIYWFIPWQHLRQKSLIEDQEFACDEKVINETGQLSLYAQLLFNLDINRDQQSRGVINEHISCSASFNLKERIMKLDQVNKKQYQVSIMSIFLIAVFSISTASSLPKLSDNNTEVIELVPTSRVAPKYPYDAYKNKITGQVSLKFIVSQKGTVSNVEVLESTPPGVFDEQAIRAIKQWTFNPIATETQAQQVLEFKLD